MALITAIIAASGGDFSTPQLWEDSLVADLDADGNARKGAVRNTAGAPLGNVTFSNHTTSATNYIHLTADTGHSFMDNASVRSAPLRYDDTVYAALRATSGYTFVVDVSGGAVDYLIVDRLMIESTAGTSAPFTSTSGCDHNLWKDLICSSGNTSANVGEVWGTNTVLANVVYHQNSSSGTPIEFRNTPLLIGCTFVRLTNNGVAGDGPRARGYAFPILQSCAIFGYTNPVAAAGTGGWDAASKNNATQAASGLPGSSNQHSVTFNATTPFTQASATGTDLRAIASTSLAGNGFKDATNAPNDISGIARAASPTIGAWELITLSLEQRAFRFRNDDGSETTATWAAAQDTDISAERNATRRLRLLMQTVGNRPASTFKLQYRKVGSSTWRDV